MASGILAFIISVFLGAIFYYLLINFPADGSVKVIVVILVVIVSYTILSEAIRGK
jgi:hypothetical protein